MHHGASRVAAALLLLLSYQGLCIAEPSSKTEPDRTQTTEIPLASEANSSSTTHETMPLDDLQRFTAVVEQIRKYYVKPVNDNELFEGAIRGMLAGLDPHSSYLDPSEYTDLRANTSGKFGGLGIEVTMEDGYVRVISPIDETPAQRAGIKPGDMIVRIDDTPVKGMTLKKAVEMMRGDKGSPIMLTILRKGADQPMKIKVVRDVIQVKSVRAKVLDKNYGYIRISQFQSQTGEDLVKALHQLQEETHNQLKGLIIDLRNNPGGILEASVKVADTFLDKQKLGYKGLIVYTQGRLPGSEIKEYAHEGDLLNGAPIVVLVNGGSASASEIVAGALQDHKRGLVVGSQTFGKGSVQTVLPLKDNRGLKLTTALYYTPAGRSIQAKGIVPDIDIPDIKLPEMKKDENENWVNIRESDLENHLDNGKKAKEGLADVKAESDEKNETGKKDAAKSDDNNATLMNQDYQLNEALNLLKGLVFLDSDDRGTKAIRSAEKNKIPLQNTN